MEKYSPHSNPDFNFFSFLTFFFTIYILDGFEKLVTI